MAQKFSISSLSLNDYISPSQECVIPVESDTKVKISLNDCLACSGCVTSAESVLISQQSTEELFSALEKNKELPLPEKKTFVVSIEPRVAVAFAAKYNVTVTQSYLILSGFFRKSLGFDFAFDCSAAQSLSLLDTLEEVRSRLHTLPNVSHESTRPEIDQLSQTPLMTAVCPGFACYIEKVQPSLIPHLLTSPSVQHYQGILVKRLFAPKAGIAPKNVYHVSVAPCYDRKIDAIRWKKDLSIESPETPPVDTVLAMSEVITLMETRGYPLDSLSSSLSSSSEKTPLVPMSSGFGLSAVVTPSSKYTGIPSASGGYAEFLWKSLNRATASPSKMEVEDDQKRKTEAKQDTSVTGKEGTSPSKVSFASRNDMLQNIGATERHAAWLTRRATTNAMVIARDEKTESVSTSPEAASVPVTYVFGFRVLQTLIQKIKTYKRSLESAASSASSSSSLPLFPSSVVEVQACPSGCLGGGGLPQRIVKETETDPLIDLMMREYEIQWPDEHIPLFIPSDISSSPVPMKQALQDELYHSYKRIHPDSAPQSTPSSSSSPEPTPESLLHDLLHSSFSPRDPDTLAKSSASINPLALQW